MASDARRTHELDARAIDGEPFSDIVDALSSLGEGETLVLVQSFEPTPLYDVLDRRGFDYETTHVADGEWRVAITHA